MVDEQEKLRNAKRTVLIVEDDDFISDIYARKLSLEGFSVFIAKDGGEAMPMIREHRPDMVMLDIMIPVKTGFEVLEEIRSDDEFHDMKVIIMSNLNQEEDLASAKALGAVDYIVKVLITLDEMAVRVKKHLFPENTSSKQE